ncbi:MAG: Uma2 family endonuclease [Candidatus Competibacteraceae bacterium]|nr:Uma2 family endonuclease [Candidatus Competibacteraceae bacterium]
MPALAPVRQHHKFSVAEYLSLAEVGLLSPRDRVELVDGEILDMPPMGPEHADLLRRLNRLLVLQCDPHWEVSPQCPVVLGNRDALEPDLAVIAARSYGQAHPGAADVQLLIEVSKSSKAYDTEVKLPRYALHGIPQVWIVDVAARSIEVYSDPREDGYRSVRILRGDDQAGAAGISGLKIRVRSLFDD